MNPIQRSHAGNNPLIQRRPVANMPRFQGESSAKMPAIKPKRHSEPFLQRKFRQFVDFFRRWINKLTGFFKAQPSVPTKIAPATKPETNARINPSTDKKTAQEQLQNNLDKTRNTFLSALNPADSAGLKQAKATQYQAGIVSNVIRHVERTHQSEDIAVLHDLEGFTQEMVAISFDLAKAEVFKDLPDATQDRVVILLAKMIQHPEPEIQKSGLTFAKSLGANAEMIADLKRLRKEDMESVKPSRQ